MCKLCTPVLKEDNSTFISCWFEWHFMHTNNLFSDMFYKADRPKSGKQLITVHSLLKTILKVQALILSCSW